MSAEKIDSAAQNVAGRLRMTKRGRRALLVALALPVALFGAFGVLQVGGAVAGSEQADVQFDTVTVQQGDTLWGLAADIAPDHDPRDVVVELQNLNGLDAAVVPGQVLSIPLQYSQQ